MTGQTRLGDYAEPATVRTVRRIQRRARSALAVQSSLTIEVSG